MVKVWLVISGHAVLVETEGVEWARYSVPDLPGCHAMLDSSVVQEEDIQRGIAAWQTAHPEIVSFNIPPYIAHIAHMEGEPHREEG